MSVLSIAELKARFSSTDRPSQKDFDDLIDTLLAGTGSVTPSGPAGGDLTGTYPNPTVGPSAVTYAKMQNVAGTRLVGRHSPTSGVMEEISVGSGLVLSAGLLAWTGGGGGSGGAGTVAGAISTYTSNPVLITNVDGNLALVQAPVDFGSTLPHMIRYAAVCFAPFAGYSIGDEVPLEYFRDKTDPETPSFYVSEYVSGGQVTAKIRVELGNILASTGIAIYDRDLTTGPGPADPSLTPFTPGTPPEDFFYIRVYMARYAPGTGLGSLALFEPADQLMPAAAGVAVFAHNFGDTPSLPFMSSMVCVIADATTGHLAGDMVPVEQAFETGFANPAFGVTSTTINIRVRREATTIEIPHKTTGALTAITADANWQIRVRAARGVNLPSIAFPALTFQVSNPMCAWSYNNLLYVVHHDNGRSFLSQADLTTNNLTLMRPYPSQSIYGNVSMFRLLKAGIPTDVFFMCDNRGIWRIDSDDPTNETLLVAGNLYHYKVLDVNTGGAGGHDRPDLLYAQCTYGSANTNSGTSTSRRDWVGVYPAGAYSAVSSKPDINWSTLTGIGGAGYSSYVLMDFEAQPLLHLSYNPIKRRIYIVHNGSGYMNIFKLDPTETLMGWWDSSPDGTKLDFEKMLLLPGGGDTWTDSSSEHMFVEYDGVTGAEKAFVIVRRGNTSLTGSVCRIPWNE